MAEYIDLGDNSADGYPVLGLSVDPAASESVVVTNVAGSTITYANDVSGESGTIAATASHTFTDEANLWVSGGRASLKITGGKYGS